FLLPGRRAGVRDPGAGVAAGRAPGRGRAGHRRHLTKYPVWAALGVLILIQIGYPLTSGSTRAALTVLTVLIGYFISSGHALLTRGPRAAIALIGTATLGGFAVEAIGVATGFPFGTYDYSGQLGPKLLGVPLIIPL